MAHVWFISLLAVIATALAEDEQMMHSQRLPVKWAPHQDQAVNHPSQLLLLIAIVLVISFIGFMSKASKSRRTKNIPKKHHDVQVVGGKTREGSSVPSTKVISPILDEEFGCPSTSAGSGSDACQDDEDEDWGPDWAQDPFSDKMPEACSSWKCTQFDNQHMLSMDNLERGSKVGANPFEDDVPLISRAKGKAD
mmetsp:Transcript_86068/g.148957  ORF Transcript_86068/g.148957 Transcript_86068/m.148957 type:complete len:194 (-) Transcript_86068:203-784(-)